MVFAACYERGIPAITVAPLGMGAALLNFLPGKMSFEEYFQLEGRTEPEQLLRFLLGLAPAMLQNRYLVVPSAIDLDAHRGPSTQMGCELCAGVAGTEALKILLGRGKVIAAPRGLHFDAYRNRLVRTWRPGGNRHPIQRLGLLLARRRFGSDAIRHTPPGTDTRTYERAVLGILDLARWAPSGDNTQPWRFEISDDYHVVIHGNDTRDHCIYDLRGHASQLALGALLETVNIAASRYGLRTEARSRPGNPRHIRRSILNSRTIRISHPTHCSRISASARPNADRCQAAPWQPMIVSPWKPRSAPASISSGWRISRNGYAWPDCCSEMAICASPFPRPMLPTSRSLTGNTT